MTTKARDFFEKEMGPMSFGDFLTSARLALGLSQSDLSRKLKVSRSMICDIEKGRVLVSASLAAKIARLAGFPVKFAVKYCLQDQVRKARLKLHVEVA